MRRKWWKVLLCIVLIGVAVEGALLIGVVTAAGRMDDPQPADVIIVLGAGINMQGIPSSTLQYRLDRALQLYYEGYAPQVIVTGAQGDDEPLPEAVVMKRVLVMGGIPEEAVHIEADSYNTRENLANAKVIMDANGMETALVVTSDYHLWRALHLAEDLGIPASGAGAKNAALPYYRARNYVRETLSWVKYAFTR